MASIWRGVRRKPTGGCFDWRAFFQWHLMICFRCVRVIDVGRRFLGLDVGFGALCFSGGGREEEAGFDGRAIQRASVGIG